MYAAQRKMSREHIHHLLHLLIYLRQECNVVLSAVGLMLSTPRRFILFWLLLPILGTRELEKYVVELSFSLGLYIMPWRAAAAFFLSQTGIPHRIRSTPARVTV